MAERKRNGKIDFLKFIFAVIVVIHHGRNVIGADNLPFLGGAFAVEYFFIVSGYLLMASIRRMPKSELPIGIETRNFMVKKFKSFYPEVFVAFVLATIVAFQFSELTLQDQLILSFHELTLLNMTGMGVVSVNAPTWYLSSMLLGMLILFPLVRKKPETMSNIVLPVLILLVLGGLSGNKTSPRNPTDWMSITYKGNLRAFAEMSIGVCIYPLVEKLKSVKISAFGRVLLTILEYVCYVSLIEYMRLYDASRRDYYYLFVYVIAILISFSEQGIDTKLFQTRIFSWLGKFSFALYLGHHCWSKHLNAILPAEIPFQKRFVIYSVCAALSAAVIMVLSALIRWIGKKLRDPAKKLLLAKEQ